VKNQSTPGTVYVVQEPLEQDLSCLPELTWHDDVADEPLMLKLVLLMTLSKDCDPHFGHFSSSSSFLFITRSSTNSSHSAHLNS
jgi:hypothetical protein